MKETQHTKGPLAWQKFGEHYCLTGQYGMRPIALSARGGISVRDARGLLVPLTPDHPDAMLYAAAPDLLEALSNLLGFGINNSMESQIAQDDARAAIARATKD